MGKIFNKGLSEYDKKEGLFKRLENIKDKNEQQLQVIKGQGEKQLKELKTIYKNKTLKIIDETRQNYEANKFVPKFIKLDDELEDVELVCTKTDGSKYKFSRFLLRLKFIEKIYNHKITPNEAIEKQVNLKELTNKLNKYGPRNLRKIK